ncbi:hypothetical protein ABZW10_24555 [Kitasatospora sp. NPDC004723]|uniref:hypothetical protein n=1 Tax=Kitasatospora sp. NPDC004723 TaxID=3154288 RepID=UPI0033BFA203
MDLDLELGAPAAQDGLPASTVWRLLRHPVARRQAALLRRDLTGKQMEDRTPATL